MSLFRVATAGVTAMMLSTSALAQDDGPIIVGERPQLEGFVLTDFRVALELNAIYTDESVRLSAGARRRNREIELRETLEIAAGAFIGHRGLAELDFLGRFTPAQRHTSTSGPQAPGRTGSEWTFEHIGEYAARARILQDSDTPVTLSSSRTQSIISRQFGDTFDTIAMEHSAQLDLRAGPVPGRLRYIRRDQDTRSRTRLFDIDGNRLGVSAADFSFIQDTFQWQGQLIPGANQYLDMGYTFDNVQQIGPGALRRSFRRHDAFANHSLEFGGDRQHHLRSSLHFYNESGAFDVTRLRLSERLRLRHTPRFNTRYDYTFDFTRRPNVDQIIHRGSAGFRHRLFDSLITTGNVGASYLTLGDFTSTNIFGDVGAEYTKSVPYGRLNVGSSVSFSRQVDSDRNGQIQIINEPHTFSPAGLIILQQRLIIPASIVITDAAGIITYTPGLDFIVFDFVERVEIRRVIGGAIEDGETVLVSYRIDTEVGHTTDTLGFRVSVRYDFNEAPGLLRGLGVYARYFHQDQWRDNDADRLLPPADIREFAFGADYNLGGFTFRGERRYHESTISPFRETRLEATYLHPLGTRGSLLGTVTYLDLDRYEDEIRTEILILSGRWNQQVTDRLHLGLSASWRDERNGTSAGGTHVEAFEQRLDFSWRHRQTAVFGSARNAWIRGDARRGHFQTYQIGVRREF